MIKREWLIQEYCELKAEIREYDARTCTSVFSEFMAMFRNPPRDPEQMTNEELQREIEIAKEQHHGNEDAD